LAGTALTVKKFGLFLLNQKCHLDSGQSTYLKKIRLSSPLLSSPDQSQITATSLNMWYPAWAIMAPLSMQNLMSVAKTLALRSEHMMSIIS
jgi:hypothetical protein